MVLHAVHELEQHGKFAEALTLLDESLLEEEGILIKSRILHSLNLFDEANDCIQGLLNSLDEIEDNNLILGILVTVTEFKIKDGTQESIASYFSQAQEIYKSFAENEADNIWSAMFLHLKGKMSVKRGKLDQATKYYSRSLEIFKSLNNKREQAKVINSIGDLYDDEWKLDKALKNYHKSLDMRTELQNEYDIANSLNLIGIIHAKKNNLVEALKYFIKSKDYFESLNDIYELQKSLSNISHIYRLQGKLDEAEKLCQQSLDIAIEVNNMEDIAKSIINLSVIQSDAGDLDKAQKTSFKALTVVSQTGNLKDRSVILNNLGVINKKKGDVSTALNYYNQSLDIEKKLNNKKTAAALYHNIGSLYYSRGDQRNAIENFQHSLEIHVALDGKVPSVEQAKDLQFIGMIMLDRSVDRSVENTKEAISHLEKALSIANTYKNEILIAEVLYNLFLGYSELDENEISNKYYRRLKKLGDKSKNKTVRTRAKLAEALMIQLKEGSRMKQMVDANDLFTEVIDEGLIDIEFTIFAMLNRCEYLLAEFRMTKNESDIDSHESATQLVLDELKAQITTLYDMAQDQESHSLLLELLIIQSKLSMVESNIQEAKNYLESATEIAESMELNQYKLKISKALHSINEEMIKYSNAKINSDTLAMIEKEFVESYLEEVAVAVTEASTNHFFKEKNGDSRFNANLNLTNLLKLDKHLPRDMQDYIKFIGLSVDEYHILQKTYKRLQEFEDGTIDVVSTEFNLQALINDELNNIQDRVNNLELEITFNKSSYAEDSENLIIETDKSMLSLIIQNILINAAKFNYFAGFINILLSEESTNWMLIVKNHSKLIPKDKLSTIFDKYVIHEHDRFTRKQGAGLGLHFIKTTIEYLGGEVKLYSPIPNEEFGVQVIISIPKKYLDYV